MSDEATPPDAPQPDSSDSAEVSGAPAPTHGGAMLRMARESAGIHVGALAVSLKVPVRQLEALEAGQFDKLPGPIFVRALASSVCRQLRIDTKPVLAALPQAPTLAPRVGKGINEPFLRPGMPSSTGLRRLALKPPVLIATALALAALGLLLQPWLMRFTERSDSATAVSAPQALPAAASPDVLPPASVAAPGPGGQAGTSGLVIEQVQPILPGAGSSATLRPPAPATSTSSPGRMP